MDLIEKTKEIAGSAYMVDTLNPDADEVNEIENLYQVCSILFFLW
jgi:hypothetical protein